jgi:hypothetical protein
MSTLDSMKVYSSLVYNTTDGDTFDHDIRVSIIRGKFPFAYLKYRSIEIKFKTDSIFVKLVEQLQALYKAEIASIKIFFDFSEFEYDKLIKLCYRKTSIVYIIVINNTLHAPPSRLHALFDLFLLNDF